MFKKSPTDRDYFFLANLAPTAHAVSHQEQWVTGSLRLSMVMQKSKSQAVVNLRSSIWNAFYMCMCVYIFFLAGDLPSKLCFP